MHNREVATAIIPTMPKFVNSPVGDFPRISPPPYAAIPEEICWMDEFTLMKLPRFSGVTLDVTIAIAGTHRPEVSIMNTVVTISTIQRGSRGRFVMAMIGTIEQPIIHPKAF